MNKRTKHDLSGQTVKLDYQALLETAQIAYIQSLRRLEVRMNDLRFPEKVRSSFVSNAQQFAQDAEYLAQAAESLHALMCGLTRPNVRIMNKPPVEAQEA